MISFFITLWHFVRGIWRGLRNPEFRALLVLVIVLLLVGTLFYHRIERWELLDSLYFSVTTLTTVGYGDLAPATVAGKIFTIFYILSGIGVLVAFVGQVAQNVVRGKGEKASEGGQASPGAEAEGTQQRS